MTFAYFFLIHERIRRGGESQTWAAFAVANPDLLTGHKGILTKYYRSETIASDFARNVFVLPDKIIGSNYNAE